jgi:hypothetical protein
MKEIMTHYYIDAKTAGQNNKKVAWITSGGPVEPLIAMDVIPVYPENHGAMIGAAKMGVDLCEKGRGAWATPATCAPTPGPTSPAPPMDGGPIGGLPRPDMLVCCNNICGTVLKWYEVQARYFKVPLFILDTPFMPHRAIQQRGSRHYVRRAAGMSMSPFWKPTAAKTFDQRPPGQEVGRLSIAGPAALAGRYWTPRSTGRPP